MFGNVTIAQISSGALGCGDVLVGAVFTCDVTKIAADAQFGIDTGNNLVVQIQIAPVAYAIDRLAYQPHHRVEAFVVEILGETIDHVFNNAKAIVHRCRTDLHRGCPKRNEFGCILPVGNPTDS